MKKSKSKNKKNKQNNRLNNTRKQHISNVISSSPSISFCMIVKNEEEFLEKCLTSVKEYADEIIVVDTGSTDSTVDIAKRYTDKVYFHPWENSFCKARNQALQYATGDWVFQIDGDEELIKGSGEKLRSTIIKVRDADLIYIKINSPYLNGKKKSVHNLERLFRNNGKIHYEGNIHERIVGGTKAIYSDIELWHYGYNLDETKTEQKYIRTKTLLINEIENEPDNPLHRHYLGAAYLSKLKYKEAIDEAKKAIDLMKPYHFKYQFFSATYYIISNAYYSLGQYDLAKKYALEALEKYPGHIDSYFILTIVADKMDEWSDVIKFGKLFFKQIESYSKQSSGSGLMPHFTINEGPTAGVLIGHACHAMNDFSQMREYYKKASYMGEAKWEIFWSIVVHHLEKSGDMDCAKEYLDLVLKEVPKDNTALYMLAEYSKKYGLTDKETDALEKLYESWSNDNFVINRLFSLYLAKENYEKAYRLLISSQNINNSSYPDLLKLGNYYFAAGNLEYAMHCYMKAAESIPDNQEAWSILAEITSSLGKYENANIFLEKALAINGNDLLNLLTMCEIKLKSGDIESHVKYCDKILEIIGLERTRTIDNFGDLKNIFIEIRNSIENGINCSSKINSIINQLDTYITPAALQYR